MIERAAKYPDIKKFLKHQVDETRDGIFDEGLREIFLTKKFLHIAGPGTISELDKPQIGKIAFLDQGSLTAAHRLPTINLVDYYRNSDPISLFEKAVSMVIGDYEISQVKIEDSLEILEKSGFTTIAGFLGYHSNDELGAKYEIAVPLILLKKFSLEEALKISASFMKITRASTIMTDFRENLIEESLSYRY